jgi:hypothetical protein
MIDIIGLFIKIELTMRQIPVRSANVANHAMVVTRHSAQTFVSSSIFCSHRVCKLNTYGLDKCWVANCNQCRTLSRQEDGTLRVSSWYCKNRKPSHTKCILQMLTFQKISAV